VRSLRLFFGAAAFIITSVAFTSVIPSPPVCPQLECPSAFQAFPAIAPDFQDSLLRIARAPFSKPMPLSTIFLMEAAAPFSGLFPLAAAPVAQLLHFIPLTQDFLRSLAMIACPTTER